MILDMYKHHLDPARPLLTIELLELRARQRQILASVPDWLLARVQPLRPATDPLAPEQPERAELLVRRFLRTQIEESKDLLKEFTNTGGRTNGAKEALSYLQQWLKGVDTERGLDGLHQSLVENVREGGPIALSQQLAFKLLLVVAGMSALSDLADAMANDGYRDPRIQRQISRDHPRDGTT
jgi:hypothetical protein